MSKHMRPVTGLDEDTHNGTAIHGLHKSLERVREQESLDAEEDGHEDE